MKKFKLLSILFLAILIGACSSCATFEKNTYVALNESKDFYYIAMGVVADLQADGKITPEKRVEINKAAKIYKESHNLAVDAFAVYKVTKSSADKDKLKIAINVAASKWQSVAALINAIKPGLLPMTIKEVK